LKDSALKLALFLAIVALIYAPVQAQDTFRSPAQAANTYIPSASLDNYWTTFGGPQLSASISGTNEFSRGDTVTLYVDLTNYGKIMGFKQDKIASSPMEFALANQEQQLEAARITAIGITASMVSKTPLIEVKSGDQIIQSLKAGEKTANPAKFTIKIAKSAPAGEYPIQLRLAYDYQYNVEVYASSFDPIKGSLSGFQTSYWYQKANQTVEVLIIIKKEADFSITSVEGNLSAGQKKGEVYVVYRNTGEDPVTDAIARLSIFKPFSSTDDQAYIGNLEPGKESRALFRLDVDSDATPKEYGINSEIKYTDVNGDTQISESMKIPVAVNPAKGSLLIPAVAVLVILGGLGGYLYRRQQKKA
jgi:hypothetical protein